MELTAVSIPMWVSWKVVMDEIRQDAKLAPILRDLGAESGMVPSYTLINGVLYYRGRSVLSWSSSFIPRLLAKFHLTPQGGHSGAFHTYSHLAENVYWPGMLKDVTQFVSACLICQRHKYDT